MSAYKKEVHLYFDGKYYEALKKAASNHGFGSVSAYIKNALSNQMRNDNVKTKG